MLLRLGWQPCMHTAAQSACTLDTLARLRLPPNPAASIMAASGPRARRMQAVRRKLQVWPAAWHGRPGWVAMPRSKAMLQGDCTHARLLTVPCAQSGQAQPHANRTPHCGSAAALQPLATHPCLHCTSATSQLLVLPAPTHAACPHWCLHSPCGRTALPLTHTAPAFYSFCNCPHRT